MTAHDKCKTAGLPGLWTMIELTDVPRSTLIDWSNKMPKRFDKILKLCVKWIEAEKGK